MTYWPRAVKKPKEFDPADTTRWCPNCGSTKPVSEFPRRHLKRDPVRGICGACLARCDRAEIDIRKPRRSATVLYAVTTGVPGRLKHGTAADLYDRLKHYCVLYPECEYVWTRPGGFRLERLLHRELAPYNVPHVSGRASEVYEFGDIELGIKLLDEAYDKVTDLIDVAA